MSEYLTLIFKKPISPAVSAIFAAQEWVAASHYDALQERDNYAREVAELRAENKRLREELSKMRGALHAAAEYIGDRSAGSSTFWDLYDAVLAKEGE